MTSPTAPPVPPVTETLTVTFNERPLVPGGTIPADLAANNDVIKDTPSLWNASLADAYRYGGELTRAALGACHLHGDRRHVVVDTKVHMLMPGMLPAIPGWHTDGIPRTPGGNPAAKEPPRLRDLVDRDGDPEQRPHYHLLIADGGSNSLTEFLTAPTSIELPAEPTAELYAYMTHELNDRIAQEGVPGGLLPRGLVSPGAAVEFDWLHVHRAIPALGHGWRFLMRVTETDWIEPQTDLRQILRLHNPVYVPQEYGW